MTAKGFVYRAPTLSRIPPPLSRRYGLESLEDARAYGYDTPEVEDPSPAVSVSPDAALPEFNLALYGTEAETLSTEVVTGAGVLSVKVPGGCAGEGYSAVYGTRADYVTAVSALTRARRIDMESYSYLLSTPDYEALRATWQACLSQAGESRFNDPTEPFGLDWSSPEEERAVATKDVMCKQEIDFTARVAAIESAWQLEHLDEFQGDAELAAEWADRLQTKATETFGD